MTAARALRITRSSAIRTTELLLLLAVPSRLSCSIGAGRSVNEVLRGPFTRRDHDCIARAIVLGGAASGRGVASAHRVEQMAELRATTSIGPGDGRTAPRRVTATVADGAWKTVGFDQLSAETPTALGAFSREWLGA
jgi:hypothetical protein